MWRSCLYPTWAANNSSNRFGSPIALQESISLAANNYQIPDCNFEGVTRTYPDPRHVGELRFLLDWQSRPSCAESIRHLCPRMAGGQHRHDPQRATSKKDIQGRVCTSNRLMGFHLPLLVRWPPRPGCAGVIQAPSRPRRVNVRERVCG